MVKNIKKDIKDEKMKTKERGSQDLYDEPGVVGSLGGVAVQWNKKLRLFKKGYLPGWTEEGFQVHKVLPGMVTTYKVQELDDTPLQGTFYVWDLQKVHVDEATYFRVEKVLKRQKDKLFVKWKGYPSKYNSWINKKDLK